MKIKNLLFSCLCLTFIFIGAHNLKQAFELAGSDHNFSNFAFSDLFLSARADGESGGSCSGSTCDDANGNKYNYLETPSGYTCCGVSWITRGDKK